MVYCTTEKHKFVFMEGEIGSYFFIIDDGKAQVMKNNVVLKELSRGNFFGDLALVYCAARSASIYCPIKTNFWVLETQRFQEILRNIKTNQFVLNKKILNQIKFFGIPSFY